MPHEINHRANIWAMRSLGVRWLITVSAVGSLREHIKPGSIVAPDQLIDRTGKATLHTFFGSGIAAHVGFADPYCTELRSLLVSAGEESESEFHSAATYLCMNGPAFSTRAEAAFHRSMGADLIGMTNAPEARLAREAEISMVSLALVTDYDCWKDDEKAVEVDAVVTNLKGCARAARSILLGLIPKVPLTPSSPSHRALDLAIMTDVDDWPEKTASDLAPILGRFRSAR